MRGVKDFLKDSLPGMVDYILVISTPVSDTYSAYSGSSTDRRERSAIVDAVRQRGATMPMLDREAVPLLPHLLDVPRHLAVVTSAVIRASKGKQHKRKPSEPADLQIEEFIAKCFAVEETALHRVSQLASRASEQTPTSPTANRHSMSSTVTTGFRRPSSNSIPKPPPSSHRPLASRKLPRPATAPSPSDHSDTPQGLKLPSDVSLPSSPPSVNILAPSSRLLTRASQVDLNSGLPSSPEEGTWSQRKDKHAVRSTSTDSIPPYTAQSPADSSPVAPKVAESRTESDDQTRKKKSILRGILTRR